MTPVRATSSIGVVEIVDSTIRVPSEAAARAVASSPSRWARRWNAVGARAMGNASGVPSTAVSSETFETSFRTRGRSAHRANARRFSASVHSSPAAPA